MLHFLIGGMVVASWIVVVPVSAFASPKQLDDIITRAGLPRPLNLVIVPPTPEMSPLPKAEMVSLMAQEAAEIARGVHLTNPPKLLDVLEEVRRTQGEDALVQALTHYASRDIDLAMTADARPSGDGLAIVFSLIDVRSGRLLGSTTAKTIALPVPTVADLPGVLREVLTNMREAVPDIAEIATEPLRSGSTRIPTLLGRYVAEEAGQAWLSVGNSSDAIARGDTPARLVSPGLDVPTLSGTLWPLSDAAVLVVLKLTRGQAEIAGGRFAIEIRRLPNRVRRSLEAGTKPAGGFVPLLAPDIARGDAFFEMELAGGGDPIFQICPQPQGDPACERLELRLRANVDGVAGCMMMDEVDEFGLIVPSANYGLAELRRGRWRELPKSLPADPGHEIYWYMTGEPNTTLLLCALWEHADDVPTQALARQTGREANGIEIADILRDSAPLAVATGYLTLQSGTIDRWTPSDSSAR